MGSLIKVLIVDDELLIRQGILHYVNWEKEGFEIVGEVSNGVEALALIETQKPAIIITDIVMPVMDGTEFIKKVKKEQPHIDVIVLSSFNNFDYVRSTFQNGVADYILKPKLDGKILLDTLKRVVTNRSLSNNIETADETIDNQKSISDLFKKLLAGYASTSELELLKTSLPNEMCCLVELNVTSQDEQTAIKPLEQIEFMVQALEKSVCHLLESTERASTFIINLSFDAYEMLIATITDRNHLTSNFTWLITEQFNQVDQLPAIYQGQLVAMRKYLFYLTDERVLRYNNLPDNVIPEVPFDLNYFLELFKYKKVDESIYYLNKHIDYLTNDYTSDRSAFKSFLGNVIFNVMVVMDQLKYDTNEFKKDKYEYFNQINNAYTAEQARKALAQFMLEIKAIIYQADSKIQTTNMTVLLAYIDEHYSESISLTGLAKHFHFNPSYLSAYFSMHHNLGFSEYLTGVRIGKAKELLENSQISISDISGMVGYADHSYFCKVFKKRVNKSPGSYRKDRLK
ncbi:response regulator transcription factor [Paraliobacillus sp. X-1268]|uniref:response regulator transcription factor n=1 Tax=Paraliobacillus sp. X-1268 TaxID=2213193 RepID=UPI000E3BC9AB|nr:response regulator transcription factor [Paraliobacillus sp. X-1268]